MVDLRRIDAQIRGTRARLAATVTASGTTLTGMFGVGPMIAAAIIGALRPAAPARRARQPGHSRIPH